MDIKIGPSETLTLPERRPRWRGRWTSASPPDTVSICLSEKAFLAVHEHAASRDHEIGGLLLGSAFTWKGQTCVEVEAALPGEITEAGPAHVTFTAETWAKLLLQQERELPGMTIVGWYHSHPYMGIFLSGMDLTIQQHFFPQPWHVTLVVNGQDYKAGFFGWSRGEICKIERFGWLPASPWQPGIALRRGEHPFRYDLRLAAEKPLPRREERPKPRLLPLVALLFAWLLLILFRHLRSSRNGSRRRYRDR